MTTRDLKLKGCLRAFDGVSNLLQVVNPELQHVAEAYLRNLTRVHSLILFPPAAVQMAVNLQNAVHKVRSRKPTPTGHYFNEAIKEILDHNKTRISSLPEDELKKYAIEVEGVSIGVLETLADDIELLSGFEAWIASQITGTWTAFESMSGDLWEAALNCKPKELAKLSGQKGKQSTELNETNKYEGRQIDLNLVIKYNFDVSKCMGTILKERYQFDSLGGIKKAYKMAFGSCFDAIIDSAYLEAISVVRNNLVHNGGIIDDKYLKRKSVLPPEALGDEGCLIPLDGELSTILINPVLNLGNDLIIAVDNWLTTH